MKIAVLSDTHLGDNTSRLVDKNGHFSKNTAEYRQLKNGITQFTGGTRLDYLVLSGDIMDFTINSIDNSIRTARAFFTQLAEDNITSKIIYIPGNHDKQVWDGLQWDTSIIGNLYNFRDPKPFKRIQPAVINRSGKIILEGIKPGPGGKFGNIFLKGLFEKSGHNPDIILSYPSLYIERNGHTVIITHGHMFDNAWVLLSDLFKGVQNVPPKAGLRELEEWNVPLTSMICTGVGSGGDVSKLFYDILCQAYQGRTAILSAALDIAVPRLKTALGMPWYKKILIPDWFVKWQILSSAKKASDPRRFDNYIDNKLISKHVDDFLNATMSELERLALPEPDAIIFGHTHHSYPESKPYKTGKFPGIDFYNTGGWLEGGSAEVFLMDDRRFTSFRI